MYWYDFGRWEVYVGNGGKFKHSRDCDRITESQWQKIQKLFAENLLKIYYSDERSYDNSDDERVTDSYYSSASYVYREVDLEQNLFGLAMRDGEVVGVAFYVKNNSRDVYTTVFNFSGEPRTSVTLGYSASHSSSYTTIRGVELVKRGENGAPESANSARFIQHTMYPEL